MNNLMNKLHYQARGQVGYQVDGLVSYQVRVQVEDKLVMHEKNNAPSKKEIQKRNKEIQESAKKIISTWPDWKKAYASSFSQSDVKKTK